MKMYSDVEIVDDEYMSSVLYLQISPRITLVILLLRPLCWQWVISQ